MYNKFVCFLLPGVPSFIGCDGMPNCNLGTTLRVTEDEPFLINFSLVFQHGGPQGINQAIHRVRLVNTNYSVMSIFFCTMSSSSCSSRSDTPYSDRITYSGQRSPWSNITVTISDSSIADSGIYRAEVDIFNPNGQSTLMLSSIITISISTGTCSMCV